MSRPTKSERQYELVDVDVSIVSLDDTAETTNVIATGHAGPPPPTLLAGEVIDGKNTLQSFDEPGTLAAAMSSEGALEDPVHPTLPGGAVITGKNTLQSFDANELINQPTRVVPPLVFPDDAKQLPSDSPSSNSIATMAPPSTTVVAVAVTTDIVYAELVPELGPSSNIMHHNGNQKFPVASVTPWFKRRSNFALMTFIIIVLLAVVLGVTIGLSSTSSSSKEASKNIASLPTMAPIAAVTANVPNTSVPTMAPIAIDPNITLRAAVLTSYINNITLSNHTIAANGTSPESQALSWLIYNDTFLETTAVISEGDPISKNAIGFRIRQRYPLLVMWFQQTETAKWVITTGWLMDLEECAWDGVSCKPSYVYYDDDFNGGSENAVTQVSFNLIGSYVGDIPSDIGLLTTLEHFEIQNTQDQNNANGRYLLGSLPNSIGQWTALTYFDISGNALNGTLPDSIGQWTVLTSFIAKFNALTGTLPYSIGQWTALTSFDASGNFLNGTLPLSIGLWTALTSFDASGNFLNGTLPVSIGQWTALSYFDVGDNSLTGTLLESFGQWTDLTYFDVNSNALTSTLPNSIGQWTALTSFNVYDNALTGTLPDIIGQWTALTSFDAAPNNLNGTIPSSIGNWSLIEYAYFYENHFVGTVPSAFCQFIDPDTDYLSVDCTVICTCCTIDCSL
jgi:hypothetical protein